MTGVFNNYMYFIQTTSLLILQTKVKSAYEGPAYNELPVIRN